MGDAPDSLAVYAYRTGVTPLDYAIESAAMFIALSQEVPDARAELPGAFPFIPLDADPDYWARRLIASLLDAGWTLPQVDGTQDGT